MSKLISICAACCLAFVAWCATAVAEEENSGPTLLPVEMYTCNYLKGKDRADLDKVIARWNAWTDANDGRPYNAWILTPAFTGPEIKFDVAWLGAWPTYADMGASLQTWAEDGGDLNKQFFNVFSCDQHVSMAALPMQAPAESSSGLVRFMDCTVSEGTSSVAAVEAHSKFSSYMQSKGSETAAWVFFPGMGAGKIDYDYKMVLANADFPSLAKDGEIIFNHGGWMEAGKTFDGITQCDSPRLYQSDLVRNGMSN